MRFRCALLLVAVSVPALRGQTPVRPEIIRGQVKTDSGRVIAAADVIVTMAPNREIFRAASDSAGRYSLTIDKGTGDYLVYIGAPGRRPFRKRIIRNGSDSVYVVDAVLAKEVTAIAPVRTTAQRTPPRRGDDASEQVGSLATQFGGVVGALSPDQVGDLASMAALIPGVATTPDGGISIFGIDAGQNRATLNGMTFDGASLPRDLPTRTRVASTMFDPTIGGFGGLYIQSEIIPGQTLSLSRGHITLDAPQLQAVDATGRSLGQRYSQMSASYGRSGELSQDLWVYSASVQGSRRSSPLASLSTADAAALARLGVSSDSASRLLDILGTQGAPFRASQVGGDVSTTSFSGGFRLDRIQTYSVGDAGSPETRVRVSISGIGSYSRNGPSGSGALASSSLDTHGATGSMWLQTTVSQYFGKNADYLSESKMALSYRDSRTSPYVNAPSGSVLVTSDLEDGSQSANFLRFGGSSSATHSANWRWEGSNEVTFSPVKAPGHTVKVLTEAQIDHYNDAQTSALGAFAYNSLADLQANSPASYSRALFSPGRSGGEVSGAFAVGDYWTKTRSLSFVFGPRVEWSTFTRAPLNNPEVERLFGEQTSHSPSSVHVSPRIGFSWLYHGLQPTLIATAGPLGTAYGLPRGILRGGIGEFRAPYSPTLLSSAISGTGLPGLASTRLSCVGAAVPTPNWSAYSSNEPSIPTTCADGSNAAAFTDAAPSINLFDPSYTAARRWTGNLNWSSVWRFFTYSVDGVYSLNLNQPGIVDLNYNGQQQFALGNEANRPVFVSPSSIVSSTGLVSPLDARVSGSFGRVLSHRSDLRSETKQATIMVQPVPLRRFIQAFFTTSYTYSASRSLSGGFDENTFGDPRTREWSVGQFPRHMVKTQAGYRFRKLNSSLSTSWIFQSGYAYTPIVGGDINGDGVANDRAFIFNPATASASIAAGMRDFLSSTSGDARDCLQRQLGVVAQRNSCRRPWTATMNARFNFDHRLGDQYHFVNGSINFWNPLAGLDQLLHGSNNLRGWGAPASPDQTLYYVRGFDQSTRQFIYTVNPRFGNTRRGISTIGSPFRITAEVNFSLNGNVLNQRSEQLLRSTRNAPGVRPPADTIVRRLTAGGGTPLSPFYWVLANADSLLLTREQLNAITAAAERMRVSSDSTYRALAEELARTPKDYDINAITKRVQQGNEEVFSAAPQRGADELKKLLTPIQFRLLPLSIQNWGARPFFP